MEAGKLTGTVTQVEVETDLDCQNCLRARDDRCFTQRFHKMMALQVGIGTE